MKAAAHFGRIRFRRLTGEALAKHTGPLADSQGPFSTETYVSTHLRHMSRLITRPGRQDSNRRDGRAELALD